VVPGDRQRLASQSPDESRLQGSGAGFSNHGQDLGRPGWQAIGVPVSGALDAVNLRLANALVGNPPEAPALELLFSGPGTRGRGRHRAGGTRRRRRAPRNRRCSFAERAGRA